MTITKRGRKSAAELAVAPVVTVVPRPVAPDSLTEDEAQIWDSAVASMAGTYFRGANLHTLESYCRHAAAVRDISAWIKKTLDAEDSTVADVDRLMKMRERETRAANALARSLRLTKQAQVSKEVAGKRVRKGPFPWEHPE